MNFTSKSRYALKIMIDLASRYAAGPQKRSEVAQRQSIPLEYMDHVLAELRRAGLILTRRGRAGGLELSRDPAQISLWQIFREVEGEAIFPVRCLTLVSCNQLEGCNAVDSWFVVMAALRDALTHRTLASCLAKLTPP